VILLVKLIAEVGLQNISASVKKSSFGRQWFSWVKVLALPTTFEGIMEKVSNNIRQYLAGRPIADIAVEMGVSRQTVVYWANGQRKPHQLRMVKFLTVLGKPWGRILEVREVFPE